VIRLRSHPDIASSERAIPSCKVRDNAIPHVLPARVDLVSQHEIANPSQDVDVMLDVVWSYPPFVDFEEGFEVVWCGEESGSADEAEGEDLIGEEDGEFECG
jgi:hypothetical protein